MKIVITGGAGFIGSHIAEYWTGKGAEVHVMDNLRTGKKENIEALEGVRFHHASITDREVVFGIIKNARYVFHLAALVSVPESIQKPAECVDINVKGLLNVLDASRESGVKKVVFSSSAAIYGDNPESPKRTSMTPRPKTPYGITKLDGEYYLKMYNDEFGLDSVALRYFNVFGPRQDPASQYAAAIPVFINRALKNQPIVIFGDGEQTRDFIYVSNIVELNAAAALEDDLNGVFNAAGGEAVSITTIARLIIDTVGSGSEIVYEDERPGDIKHSLADISETVEKLKYRPVCDLGEGLRKTIEYFAGRFGG